MRRRSSWAVALGAVALVLSWLFGSIPAAVIGVGLALAGIGARCWARLAAGSLVLERRVLPGERIEGADVVVEVRVAHRRRLLGGAMTVGQALGGVVQECRLPAARAVLTFEGLPRGRHHLEPLIATLIDPLGLERVEHRLDEPTAVLVRPRLPVLGDLFSARGARETGSARAGPRRPTGFEIHAVREYGPGDPLRSVHWPSTARRGSLMVKEPADAPREDVVIVLDQDPACVAGPSGESSFDAAVRASGALAQAHLASGRRVTLVGTARGIGTVHLRGLGPEWEDALDLLAAVEPDVGARLDHVLSGRDRAVGHAREVAVVTAVPERAGGALDALRRAGRSVSLVLVASETFAGAPERLPRPEVLRAAARGVAVAVVRAGVPLEVSLARHELGAVGG